MNQYLVNIQQHLNELAGLVDSLRREAEMTAARAEKSGPQAEEYDRLVRSCDAKKADLAEAEAALDRVKKAHQAFREMASK